MSQFASLSLQLWTLSRSWTAARLRIRHRQVVDLVWWLEGLVVVAMAARYKGYRYPIEVIGHAVWLYHRFGVS